MIVKRLPLLALSLLASPLVCAESSPAPDGAHAYFISPANGAHLQSPVTVQFGLNGMGVAPAGVNVPNTGHHHLLVNADPAPALDQPLPSNDQVRHFGKGQTETTLQLEPGQYTLQLVLGDYTHTPHNPPVMSGTIRIVVTE